MKRIGTLLLAGLLVSQTGLGIMVGTTYAFSPGLQGPQLQVCQTLSSQMLTQINSLLAEANTMYTQLTTIETEAEQAYQSTKALSTGISNYDTLIAQVKTTQTAAQTAMEKVQKDITGFSCTLSDPIGYVMQTKDDVVQLIQALMAYKQAVEALLTAVQSSMPTSTPTPTQSGLTPTK